MSDIPFFGLLKKWAQNEDWTKISLRLRAGQNSLPLVPNDKEKYAYDRKRPNSCGNVDKKIRNL